MYTEKTFVYFAYMTGNSFRKEAKGTKADMNSAFIQSTGVSAVCAEFCLYPPPPNYKLTREGIDA